MTSRRLSNKNSGVNSYIFGRGSTIASGEKIVQSLAAEQRYQVINQSFDEKTDSIMLDSVMNSQLPPVVVDPKAEKFKSICDAKMKEFRTLRQLESTLSRQTPIIQNREKSSTFTEHSTTKKLALQVKQLGRSRRQSTQQQNRVPKNSFEMRSISVTPALGLIRTNYETLQLSSIISATHQ